MNECIIVIQWIWKIITFGLKYISVFWKIDVILRYSNWLLIKATEFHGRRFNGSLRVSAVLSEHNGLCSYIKDIIAALRICSTEQINWIFTFRINWSCKTIFCNFCKHICTVPCNTRNAWKCLGRIELEWWKWIPVFWAWCLLLPTYRVLFPYLTEGFLPLFQSSYMDYGFSWCNRWSGKIT